MTRPLILISTASVFRDYSLRRTDSLTGLNYSEGVLQAGGLPLMVANLEPHLAADYIARADGLVLSGGADLDPELFGEEPHPQLGKVDPTRDAFEVALYKAARARCIPVLGICRGIQVINVAEGGSLHQHIPALLGSIKHDQEDIGGTLSHAVTLESDSLFAKAVGGTRYRTNSYHHQAANRIGKDLRVTGRTSDGIVEVLEGTGNSFVLGVQWHPEMSFQRYPEQFPPFALFMEAVKRGQLAAV